MLEVIFVKRNKQGRDSDVIMLNIIKEYAGLSQYELGKELGWNSGRVDGSVRRLVNAGKVVIRVWERNGRYVNLVYPKKNKPSNIIEVPTELLKVGNPTWHESAHIYALDNSTIGIAGEEIEEWNETACFTDIIPLKRSSKKVALRIPEKFKNFYNINQRHKVVSISGNAILVTISGHLVERKKYPT